MDIAVRVREHLDAGADHVTLLPSIDGDLTAEVGRLGRLAPALVML